MLLPIAIILIAGYIWTRQKPDARVRIHRWLAFAYLWTKKKFSKPKFNFNPNSEKIDEIGVVSLPEIIEVEHPRKLLSDINAVDSLRFHGVNRHGAAVSVQLDRRHGRVTETSVYLRLPSGDQYQLPSLPDSRVTNTDGRRFNAAGLNFQVLEPLRKWRITFNGHLRKIIPNNYKDEGKGDMHLVRFSFFWQPIFNYQAFPDDFDIDYLSTVVATTPGINNVCHLYDHFPLESLEQCGQLFGNITVEDQPEEQILVRGFKQRKHGISDLNKVNYAVSIEGYLDNGTNFHLFGEDREGGIPDFVYGYVNLPCNMKNHHIKECKFDFKQLVKKTDFWGDIFVKFAAGGTNYNLRFRSINAGYSKMVGERWQHKVTLRLGEVMLNGKNGHGSVEISCAQDVVSPPFLLKSLPLLQEPDLTSCSELTVSFRELHCMSSKIVGGKGSSLALLTSLETMNKNFTVPQGLCITQTAFAFHLEEHPDVVEAITQMENVAWKRIGGNLEEACKIIVESMEKTSISLRLKLQLKTKLSSIFDDSWETLKFAVRSSALGEDGEEMSAAGQNETFLGVKGLDNIGSAVIKCWASQFSFRSVEYKRQNGQLLNSGMGVVVQQMVPADVAGVLFSRDPLTGSLGKMILTSNYGLGESVVSALADPDTITINRSWDNQLSVDTKHIGNKSVMISMTDSGTEEQNVATEKSSECTVSETEALKLAKIAVFLEKCFGTGRDIEWAIQNGDIYLLQSRPVTNDNPFNEFEVFHEFDTIMKTDAEHFSTANVGEVFPGAMCTLTPTSSFRGMLSFMQKIFSYKIKLHRYDPTTVDGTTIFYGHLFFDQIQQKTWVLEKEKSVMTQAMDIGFYGRILDDTDVCEKAIERYDNPPFGAKFKVTSYSIGGMLFGWLKMRRAAKRYNKYASPSVGLLSIEDVYQSISDAIIDVNEVLDAHLTVTFASNLWNLLCFTIISGGKGLTQEHYMDFASLIGSENGTLSGEVPFRIRDLARTIVQEADAKEFCSMSQEDALTWLKNNKSESGKKFHAFLDRHGHRGMQEFDMYSISWEMNPKKLIKALQDTAKFPSELTVKETIVSDPLDSIKTPVTGIRKKLLSLVLRGAKMAVCQREQTKSWSIKYFDGMRKAYRHLADLMVKEGYLPEEDLLFFLSHEEIKTLIDTRSPNLLRLAKQRHRAWSTMNNMKFPEMSIGYPVPIDENEEIIIDDLNKVTGFPVSKGIIKGPAKVVRSIDEIHTIEPGDILIARATDIGWSPYFPMLAGVVTEIGGLISHGAVVAREFGLPCIVGAQHATKVFKTGDIVLLNANTGIISKVIN